jgi:hypothetical protein
MGLEGKIIDGKYRVGRRLGSGGMGEVYEALHEGTERTVAIKVLYPEYTAHPEALVRFDREARAAGRIGHDNICEVIDVGRMDTGAPYIVMPLLRGQALADVMRQAGPLPVARCVDVVSQILVGLDAAHKTGIVHRDLKPDNVFLVRMGDREDFVKVLDFGIAKVIRDHITDAKLTQTGTVMGTPFYMSPEQARGITNLDHRVDIYAAGVILYEMLTTRTPFVGDTYNQILSAILLDPFPPPRSLRKDIPPAIEMVILRAMARDRDQRFADAVTMRRALLDAVKAGAAAVPADTAAATLQTAAPFVPARPEAGLHAPHAPAVVGSTSSSTIGPAAAMTEFATLQRSRRRGLLAAAAVVALVAGSVGIYFWQRTASPSATSDATALAAAADASTAGTAVGGPLASTTVAANAPDPLPATGTVPAIVPAAAGGIDAGDPDAASTAASAVDAATATPDVPTFVNISLEGLPDGASIRVDGRVVPTPSFDVPRANRELLIVVTADRYAPWERTVSALEGAAIPVRMRRLATGPRTSDAATAADTAAAQTTKALQPFGEGP